MKRKLLLVVLFVTFGIISFGQYVTIQGRQFKDENGEDFYPVVCNYCVSIVISDTNDFSSTFISPGGSYGSSNSFECTCQDSCDVQLRNDFLEILYMGFNTVRIMGIHPYYLRPGFRKDNCFWESPVAAFYLPTEMNPPNGCPKYYIIQEPYTNDTAQQLYELVNHLISLISEVEYQGERLKVILISGGSGGIYSTDFPGAYSEYLSVLTDTLSSVLSDSAKATLMAYDLFNEPYASWQGLWPDSINGHSKQDACENVRMWYDAVKEKDSDHLITFGGGGTKDIWEYDMSILKLDFYSLHIYPSAHPEYENSTHFEAMVNRKYGDLYWTQNNCPMPWIIGETGFRAVDGSSFGKPYNGTLLEQKDYADSLINQTSAYGGSGFSWWSYQDAGWLPGEGYGILKKFQTCTAWPCDSILKPVWEAFEDFSPPPPGSCEEPPHYYDPYYHEIYGKDTNVITGYVVDQTGGPIKDAYILAVTALYDTTINGNEQVICNPHYTFSNDSGYFIIKPMDFRPDKIPNRWTIERLTISAPICSRYDTIKWGSGPGVVTSELTYVLSKPDFGAVKIYENIVVATGTSKTFQAWDKVTLTNVEVQQNSSCEVKALSEITVNQEFTAANGSETWIHTGNVILPCDSLYAFSKSPALHGLNYEKDPVLQKKEIRLNFEQLEGIFDALIYPNPGTGVFNLEIQTTSSEDEIVLSVFNQYGSCQYSSLIFEKRSFLDLSHLSKGMYFIQLRNSNHTITKKIIII